jgi:PilX N-terminal
LYEKVADEGDQKMKCNTLPPQEIYDVLHAAEVRGVELPESVELWWFKETQINQKKELERIQKMKNNKGFVLVTGLLLIMVLTILSVMATMMITTDLKVASADRSIKQGFYISEAGTEEARARLQPNSANVILDNQESNPAWKVFIGSQAKAQDKGYDSGNINHLRVDSMTNLDYVVTIEHKVNELNQVIKWGDDNYDGLNEENIVIGMPIYVVTAEGIINGTTKKIRTEVVKFPPIPIPAALYAEDFVTINGSSSKIHGIDACGSNNIPGAMTRYTLNISGKPDITGNPSTVQNSAINYDIPDIINNLKGYANIVVPSGQYNDANWGDLQTTGNDTPNTCMDTNIVYVNGDLTLKSQGNKGCGILLVNGNLKVNGGFKWYGPVVVSGIIDFSGGGQRNITGAILSGGTSVTMDDSFGGNSVLLYCSTAIMFQTQNRPLLTLRWVELFN